MNMHPFRIVTLAICFGLCTHAAYAQTRQQTPPATQTKPVLQMKRLDGVSIEKKQNLATLNVVQRNDIKADLKTLIDADPVLSLSVEEFRFVVGVQQWAIAQHKRITFVDVLKARRDVLVAGQVSLKQKKDIAGELAIIDDKLNALGEDGQLANVDLQSNMQKMQQALQVMSNASKAMHDTAMNVIKKIG